MAGPSCRVGGRFLTQSSHWHICKNKKRYYSISIANGAKRDPRDLEKLDIFISGQPRSPIISFHSRHFGGGKKNVLFNR